LQVVDSETQIAIEVMAADRRINGTQMIKKMIKYALDVKQSKCNHKDVSLNYCNTCGKDMRAKEDF
jgi:hypothetical protein